MHFATTAKKKNTMKISARASFYTHQAMEAKSKFQSQSCDFQNKLNEDYLNQMQNYNELYIHYLSTAKKNKMKEDQDMKMTMRSENLSSAILARQNAKKFIEDKRYLKDLKNYEQFNARCTIVIQWKNAICRWKIRY